MAKFNMSQFTTYYLSTTRTGTKRDMQYLYDACPGNYLGYDIPVGRQFSQIKTAMISNGCEPGVAESMIRSLKKWLKDMT